MTLALRRGLAYPLKAHARRKPIVLVPAEKVFQDQVVSLARLYGWRAYHTFDSRRSVPGYPDLTLVRGGRLIFAELKVRGRPTDAQDAWLEDLRPCAEVYVWYPRDLPVITAILSRRSAA